MRSLLKQTSLAATDFIYPIFVQETATENTDIAMMPGIKRLHFSDITDEIESIVNVGIPAIMLFGIPATKDKMGSLAFDKKGIVQQAASIIRQSFGDEIVIMADVCLCQYTLSGHCGIIHDSVDGTKYLDNDTSVNILAKIAVSQAEAGVDVVTPSAMMDGQVTAIRSALDNAGFSDTLIMSQSAKHKSAFYAPFRDATECAPQFGDRATYQVPYTNSRESILEMESDVSEGADIIMVKPALAYLDIVSEARKQFDLPISTYSASGEYAMIRAAAAAGYVDEKQIALEVLHSIKRAGADMMVTYFAKDVAQYLSEETK